MPPTSGVCGTGGGDFSALRLTILAPITGLVLAVTSSAAVANESDGPGQVVAVFDLRMGHEPGLRDDRVSVFTGLLHDAVIQAGYKAVPRSEITQLREAQAESYEPIGISSAPPKVRGQPQRLTDNLDTVDQAPAASSTAHFTTTDRAGPRTPGAPRP